MQETVGVALGVGVGEAVLDGEGLDVAGPVEAPGVGVPGAPEQAARDATHQATPATAASR